MSNIIRSFIVRTGVDMSGMTVGLSRLSTDLKRAGRQITSTGQSLTKNLTIPLLAVAATSIKFASDFDDGMAKVNTIADTAAKSIGTLGKEVMSTSDDTGKAADELSESLYQAISAGADTAGAMDLVGVASKTAIAGFTDTTTAVDGLTSVINAYGLETTDADEVANKFLITQNKGKTTFAQLASSIGGVVSISATAGVSIDDLLSSLATLTMNGISTDEAVTGVKSALSNIIKPSSEAAKTAKQLGIDFSATALQSKGLAGFLADVKEKTGGNIETIASLFGNVRGLNAVLKLTSNEGLAQMNDIMGEMQTNTTALDDAYETMSGTMSNQLKIALNSLKNVGIELGQKLMPIVNDGIIPAIKGFAEWVGKLVDGFNNLSPFMQQMITLALAITVAIGPLTTIVGKFITTLGALYKALSLAKAAMASQGLMGAITAFMGPAGVVVAAIAAIAVVVGTLVIVTGNATKEMKALKDETEALIDEQKKSADTFSDSVTEIEANASAASTLTDELYDLASKENKSAAEKLRMKDIVNQLNKMYEGLNLTIDETTGKLNLEKEAVEDVIAVNLKQLKLSAYSGRLTELYEEQYEAAEEYAKVVDSLSDKQKDAIDTLESYGYSYKDLKDAMDGGITSTNEARWAWTEFKDAMWQGVIGNNDAAESFINSAYAEEQNTLAITDAETAYGNLNKEIAATSDSIEETGTAWEDLSDTQKTALEKMGVQQDTYTNMTDEDLQTLVDSYNQWNDDIKSATDQYLSDMGGFWSDTIDMQEEGMDDVQKNLEKQIEQFNAWRTNIRSLVGKVPQDVYDYLYQLGPTASELIAQMSTASKPRLDDFVSTVEEWMEAAADEAEKQIGGMPETAANAIKDTADVINKDTSVEDAAGNLGEDAESAYNGATSYMADDTRAVVGDVQNELNKKSGVVSSASSLGASISNGMKSGMSSRFSSLIAYAKRIARSVINAIKNVIRPGSPSKVTTEYGKSISDGLFTGIAQTAQKAISKARDLSTGIIDALSFDSIQTPSLAGFNMADSAALQRSLQLDLANASAVKSPNSGTPNINVNVAFTGDNTFSNDMDVKKVGTMLGYYLEQNLSANGVK